MRVSYFRSSVLKFLHGLMALGVVFQLVMILFRESVDRHGAWAVYRQTAITLHKYVGVAVFFIVVAFFAWKIISDGKASFLQFYPVTKKSWAKVLEDVRCLFSGKLPFRVSKDSLGGVSGLVEGLGLLLVFGLALLGSLAMLSWFGLVIPAAWGHDLIQVHKFFAGLIWWYLGGHVGMAVIHQGLPARFQREF